MKKIIILLSLLCSSFAHAEIIVNETDSNIFIGDALEYYEDKDGLNFEDILQQVSGWRTSPYKSVGLGYTKSACWIRFDIKNNTNQELYLTFNVINNDLINLYILNNDGSYIEKTGGSIYPFNQREVYDKNIFFIIPKYDGIKTIYARIKSNYVLEAIPEIVTSANTAERAIKSYMPLVFYHGILIALIIYHLFIFFSSREINCLVLVFLIASFCLYDLAHDGLGFMLLWPEFVYFEKIVIPLSVALMHITAGIFIQLTIGVKRKYRITYRIINAFIIACFIHLALLFFLDKYTNTGITITLALSSSFLSLLCLLYMGVIRKNRSAFFLFLGYLLFEIGNIIAIATTNPVLIKHIPLLTNYALILLFMKFTKVWFVVFFSFTLVDKINIMQKNLEISRETYKSIFHGTNEAFVILDKENYTLVDCNRQFLSMFNVKQPEIIGKTPGAVSAAEDGYTDETAFELISKMKSKNPIMFDWYFKKTDGEKFWAEVALSNVTLNGIKRILGVIRDISDRKKSEAERKRLMEQLTQSQKMEAVGSLAGGLAHDFNNILTGIIGSSSMLELHINNDEIDRSRMKKYITIINESAQKAAAVVRRLLTLTRKSELTFNTLDLNMSLKNVIEICINSFPKSVVIQEKYYDKPAVISADSSGLEQVLLNILVNASHALTIMRQPSESQGGIIAVKIDKQYADETFCKMNPDAVKNINYFSVSIQDNGTGIDEKTIDKIFDPFFTTKGQEEGSGLGLSMVFSIVRQHNGIVKVYSEKSAGTTFIVYLPEDTTRKTLKETETDRVIKGKGKILVIDDESTVRTIAEDMLVDFGYEVITAAGGSEGLEIFSRNAKGINTILLDTSMPDLSGLETFKKLKTIEPSVKVIMSSGFSMDERVQKAIDLGADAFIQKPYSNIQLSRIVHDVISKS